MSLTEKTAYLRGLMDGLKISAEHSDEQKLLVAMVEVLDEIAVHVDANEESVNSLADELDELDDAITELEEIVLDEDEDDMDEDMDEEEPEGVAYMLECPDCGADVPLDEEALTSGHVLCPDCHQEISFEITEEAGDEEE